MPMSRDAKLLIRTARRVERGPDGDARARMRKHVLGAIGASAALGGATSASAGVASASAAGGAATGTAAVATPAVVATVAKTSLFVKALGALVVVGALGGGAALVASNREAPRAEERAPVAQVETSIVQQAPPKVSEPPSVASTAAAAQPNEPVAAAAEEIPPSAVVVSAAPSAVAKPSAAASSTVASVASVDPLKEETALLASAQSALAQGDASRALAITEDHAARFPNGVLAGERKAVRALALCKAGRKEEGRAEAQPLVARAPDSPLAQRVAAACK